MAIREKLKLGDVLMKAGAITEQQLMEALAEQKKTGIQLGKILVHKHYLTEDQLIESLSRQLGVPIIDLQDINPEQDAINKVKENVARRHQVLPIGIKNGRLQLAMSNPLNLFAIDQVTIQAGMEVDVMITSEGDIEKGIQDYYGVAASIQAAVKSLGLADMRREQARATVAQAPAPGVVPEVADAPVARLVEMLIKQALDDNASDIHIEPSEKDLRIRYRIDGVLFEATKPPKSVESALISRIKVMANMDIAETRAPQDGGFSIAVSGREIEMRVSSCPTIWGENVVLRILDRSKLLFGLDDLGLLGAGRDKFQAMLKNPYGVILVTGPTGSGKTTTLYAALSQLNRPNVNIKTIEDPVEYRLDGIRQTQVNPKANITFATGLRSLMRQDPDIMMVGEIRDQETAEIAIQAALTGHLVFSTLHTNDAPGALSRLGDLGIEPFLLASSLTGVLAQRLVRRICKLCKESYEATQEERQRLYPDEAAPPVAILHRGKGCRACRKSGYSGRLGIFEVLTVNDSIRELILGKAPPMAIRERALAQQGMETLRLDGLNKVLSGTTTLEELDRVTFID